METKHLILVGISFLIFLAFWYFFIKKEKPVSGEFPSNWRDYLMKNVLFYQQLNTTDKARFEQAVLQFLHDISIVGAGTTIDEYDKLLVAVSGVIPLFGFPGWRYRNLNEVLLYEDAFNDEFDTTDEKRNILGMVGSGAMKRVMILSKPALHQGFKNQLSKNNVGIHEFVHLLDKADGTTDGVPELLMQSQFTIPWVKRMHKEISAIKSDDSDINPYGATNEAEFLSVVSEYFFNQPDLLKVKHPELFSLLEKIFRQER